MHQTHIKYHELGTFANVLILNDIRSYNFIFKEQNDLVIIKHYAFSFCAKIKLDRQRVPRQLSNLR